MVQEFLSGLSKGVPGTDRSQKLIENRASYYKG